jgi:hypothetical protein
MMEEFLVHLAAEAMHVVAHIVEDIIENLGNSN